MVSSARSHEEGTLDFYASALSMAHNVKAFEYDVGKLRTSLVAMCSHPRSF